MDLLIALAGGADRLDLGIASLLDHFRDEHVPLYLSLAILAVAGTLLALLLGWSAAVWIRIGSLRRALRAFGQGAAFRDDFARVDRLLASSPFASAWTEYRPTLKHGPDAVHYARRPDEYVGLHALASGTYPARFFAAAHGYFIGVGLLLTFVGLVAALKFAAAGVASPDLGVAKSALNALLAAASFKFMTSIAGLGCSLVLSVAARSASYAVEGAARGLAFDLERAMAPLVAESLAFDQLAASEAQLAALERIGTALAAGPAASMAAAEADATRMTALQEMMAGFLDEMKRASAGEMKQLTTRLSHVGDAIGAMRGHVERSGTAFAGQLDLAASRLLDAATSLQRSVDGRAERMGARIDAMAATISKSENVVEAAAERAASGLLGGFAAFDKSLGAQIGSMREIVGSLDRARLALDGSAAAWAKSAAPVLASIDASRQVTAELGQVADRVAASQRDMAEMAKAVAQLSDKINAVWSNYSSRFEQVDDDLGAAFAQLQGGTRAFGEEFMKFVERLDASLANGMQAFSLGTEELREVVQLLVDNANTNTAPSTTAEAA